MFLIFVLFISSSLSAGEWVYLSYFSDTSCSGAVELRVPMSIGNNTLCYSPGQISCVDSLKGFTAYNSTMNCLKVDIISIDANSCQELDQGQVEQITYGQCKQSSTFAKCSFTYTYRVESCPTTNSGSRREIFGSSALLTVANLVLMVFNLSL